MAWLQGLVRSALRQPVALGLGLGVATLPWLLEALHGHPSARSISESSWIVLGLIGACVAVRHLSDATWLLARSSAKDRLVVELSAFGAATLGFQATGALVAGVSPDWVEALALDVHLVGLAAVALRVPTGAGSQIALVSGSWLLPRLADGTLWARSLDVAAAFEAGDALTSAALGLGWIVASLVLPSPSPRS